MEDVLEQNKLFLGGISWETTEDVLKEHFGKYGVVSVCMVAKDKLTGSSRGFGFVTFTESSAVDLALQDSHQILNRKVEAKRAIPRNEQQKHDRNLSRPNDRGHDHVRTKKIFVGGLSASLTEQEFVTYFEKFGKISDVVVMHDNITHSHRPRGFGFITFECEDSVDEVMKQNFHELTEKLVEVKRAVPRDGAGSSSSSKSTNTTAPIGVFIDYNNNSNSNLTLYPQQSDYSPYGPRFGYFPNISGVPPYGVGVYGNGLPRGGYGGSNYGLTPSAPTGPWSPSLIGFRGGFVPYGNVVPFYPTYLNSNPILTGMPSSGYDGVLTANSFNVERMHSEGADSQNVEASSRSHNGMYDLDANSSGFSEGVGASSSKYSSHRNEGKDKSYSGPTAISSSS